MSSRKIVGFSHRLGLVLVYRRGGPRYAFSRGWGSQSLICVAVVLRGTQSPKVRDHLKSRAIPLPNESTDIFLTVYDPHFIRITFLDRTQALFLIKKVGVSEGCGIQRPKWHIIIPPWRGCCWPLLCVQHVKFSLTPYGIGTTLRAASGF